jgi:hypothetical protein
MSIDRSVQRQGRLRSEEWDSPPFSARSKAPAGLCQDHQGRAPDVFEEPRLRADGFSGHLL